MPLRLKSCYKYEVPSGDWVSVGEGRLCVVVAAVSTARTLNDAPGNWRPNTEETAKEKVTVLIADDHASWERTAGVPRNTMTCMVDRPHGTQAVAKVKDLRPQILLLDLIMPEMGGVEVLEALAAEQLPTKVIVLTGADDDEPRPLY